MVLDYMVTRVIIMNSLKLDGHSLSTMRNVLLSKNTIAFIAIKNGLDDHLFLDPKDRNGTSSLAKFKAAVSDVNVSPIGNSVLPNSGKSTSTSLTLCFRTADGAATVSPFD